MPDAPERDAQVTLRLPSSLLEQLRQLAREDDRNVSQYLRVLITREVERRTKERL